MTTSLANKAKSWDGHPGLSCDCTHVYDMQEIGFEHYRVGITSPLIISMTDSKTLTGSCKTDGDRTTLTKSKST